MKLHHRILGEGQPLFILHGLFGNSDNWQTHAKKLAEYFQVVLVDQRNHGHSDWTDTIDYDLMAADLAELIDELKLDKVLLLGHSMGGKTVMRYAQLHPAKVDKMIVVDMMNKAYPPHHEEIFNGLAAVDLDKLTSRGEVEDTLLPFVPNDATRMFLMKNLYWKEKGKLAWRINVPVLRSEMQNLMTTIPSDEVMTQTLFIRGAESGYIKEEDYTEIENQFPDATIVSIPDAGHWVHAEAPEAFLNAVLEFLLR